MSLRKAYERLAIMKADVERMQRYGANPEEYRKLREDINDVSAAVDEAITRLNNLKGKIADQF